MSLAILKRPQAERDIEEAFVFIAEADFDSGLDFLFAVEQSLEFIAANPLVGSRRSFAVPGLENVRMWRVKSYEKHLLFYLVHEHAIELVRLIHSARDYRKVLED
jgi:plasmid stabilization system protein ParE